jgi:hypothetical protein
MCMYELTCKFVNNEVLVSVASIREEYQQLKKLVIARCPAPFYVSRKGVWRQPWVRTPVLPKQPLVLTKST